MKQKAGREGKGDAAKNRSDTQVPDGILLLIKAITNCICNKQSMQVIRSTEELPSIGETMNMQSPITLAFVF